MKNMYIVGINNAIDAGVCLMKNGVLLEAINEERLNRIKNYQGLPQQCLNYILDKHKLTINDIDYFTYSWYGKQNNYSEYIEKLAKRIIKALKDNPGCSKIIEDRIRIELTRDEKLRSEFEQWMSDFGISDKKIIYLDHHKSHAWAAFAPSPFDEAFIFTFDARGDLKSCSASYANKDSGIDELNYQLTFDSIGFLYGQITHYLGFTHNRHEGKVTGLAAFGDPNKTLPLFKKIITWQDDSIVANIGLYKPFYENLSLELKKELCKYSKEDIAAGLQKQCEELITKYIRHWITESKKRNVRNVCLAGGVFSNVRINQIVAEIPEIENIYVFPQMGDGGLPVGSNCYLNYRLSGQTKISLPTVYWGPTFGNGEVLKCLQSYSSDIKYEKLNKKVETVVDELINNKVVGYFCGKMEYGPRALGARSILYHARDETVNDWLNKRLRRTEFMPFGPVTPLEYAHECYKNWTKDDKCSYFMTKTYNCFEEFRKLHKAVVHIDGTARPQIVTKELNGDYYEIIKLYCDKTNEKALINTSFNLHEEPIICTPRDAIESLLSNCIDVLIIEDYEVSKI